MIFMSHSSQFVSSKLLIHGTSATPTLFEYIFNIYLGKHQGATENVLIASFFSIAYPFPC
jgi:hypothetical protein